MDIKENISNLEGIGVEKIETNSGINYGTTGNEQYAGSIGNEQNTKVNGYGQNANTGLPAKISPFTRMKNFLFQDIVLELTPYQEKVLTEVREFWTQKVTFKDVKNFLFKKIEIT